MAKETSRDKVGKIFKRSNSYEKAFWTGSPTEEAWKIYLSKIESEEKENLFLYLDDDCRWIPVDDAYNHPDGITMFGSTQGLQYDTFSSVGYFAECEDLREVGKFPWPSPEYFDFKNITNEINIHCDKAVFTGLWSCFFHVVADFFGMENYFIKMRFNPEIVEAVTDHVVSFYVESNKLFFETIGNSADVFFFGNDLGTQSSLLISPEDFKRFVLPGIKKLVEVAKSYNKKVQFHSCGAIYQLIPMLIEAGIDCLHPLQAKAAGMTPEKLAMEFKKDLTFIGGIDTQDLLVNSTPEQVKEEVKRVKDILGPNYIVSPSHEGLLPNVSFENLKAMAEAAKE